MTFHSVDAFVSRPLKTRFMPIRMGMFDVFSPKNPAAALQKGGAPSPKMAAALERAAKSKKVVVSPKPGIVMVDMCGTMCEAVEGQSLAQMAQRVRAPIRFSCMNGECGTCESLVNGRKRRLCCMEVPKKGPLVIKPKKQLVEKDW
jgi:ferredoxin